MAALFLPEPEWRPKISYPWLMPGVDAGPPQQMWASDWPWRPGSLSCKRFMSLQGTPPV